MKWITVFFWGIFFFFSVKLAQFILNFKKMLSSMFEV